jgi:hypothetical protein
MRRSAAIVLWLAATLAGAQEDWLHADFRTESTRVSDACKHFSMGAVGGCAYELFTDHPLHIAAGSLPPQNGFGLGGAFGEQRNSGNWRQSWDADVAGTPSGSWRAGAYVTMMHTPREARRAVEPTEGHSGESDATPKPRKKPRTDFVHPYTVFRLYAQGISLNKLNFFGLGNDTTLPGASLFGMTQTIAGGNVAKPVYELSSIRRLKLSLLGEVNGRFVDIRGEHSQRVPSIEALYTNASAPGMASQPGFVQLGEGFRIDPVFFKNHLELNYLGSFQQFFAPSSSANSFLRWTADLNHTIYLYGETNPGSKDTGANGPDECAPAPEEPCPEIPHSRNLKGSVGFRFLLSESINGATSAVPFYFQQTLGGSDIDGGLALGSYQDYRFRAPNLLLLQQRFEQSLWGPFGFQFMADEGRVALTRGDVGFDHLKHSLAAGLTLRAGGLPLISLMFAWGGPEGHHNIFTLNNSLLGGSSRPLLD